MEMERKRQWESFFPVVLCIIGTVWTTGAIFGCVICVNLVRHAKLFSLSSAPFLCIHRARLKLQYEWRLDSSHETQQHELRTTSTSGGSRNLIQNGHLSNRCCTCERCLDGSYSLMNQAKGIYIYMYMTKRYTIYVQFGCIYKLDNSCYWGGTRNECAIEISVVYLKILLGRDWQSLWNECWNVDVWK